MKTVVLSPLALALVLACTSHKARDSAASGEARVGGGVPLAEVSQACRTFAVMNAMKFPDSLEVLVVPDANGKSYLERASFPLLDPWGHPYEYKLLDSGSRCRITSLGNDGQRGGEGPARDVSTTLDWPSNG